MSEVFPGFYSFNALGKRYLPLGQILLRPLFPKIKIWDDCCLLNTASLWPRIISRGVIRVPI